MSVVQVDILCTHLHLGPLDSQGQRQRPRAEGRNNHRPALLETIGDPRPPLRDSITRVLEALDARPRGVDVTGYAGAEGGGGGDPGSCFVAASRERGDVQGVTTEREMDTLLIKSASRSLAEDGVKSVGGRDEGASAIRDPRGDKVRPG